MQTLPAFFDACRRNDIAAVKSAIASGIAADAKDERGLTALVEAVQYRGSDELVAVLLEGGADPDAMSVMGDSLAQMAVARGRGKVLDLLAARGADLKVRTALGLGLVGIALQNLDLPLAERLLSMGLGLGEADALAAIAPRAFLSKGLELDLDPSLKAFHTSMGAAPGELSPKLYAAAVSLVRRSGFDPRRDFKGRSLREAVDAEMSSSALVDPASSTRWLLSHLVEILGPGAAGGESAGPTVVGEAAVARSKRPSPKALLLAALGLAAAAGTGYFMLRAPSASFPPRPIAVQAKDLLIARIPFTRGENEIAISVTASIVAVPEGKLAYTFERPGVIVKKPTIRAWNLENSVLEKSFDDVDEFMKDARARFGNSAIPLGVDALLPARGAYMSFDKDTFVVVPVNGESYHEHVKVGPSGSSFLYRDLGTVHVLNSSGQKKSITIDGYYVSESEVNADGGLVALTLTPKGKGDSIVRVVDVSSGKAVFEYRAIVNETVFHPLGRYLVTIIGDKLSFRSLSDGKELLNLRLSQIEGCAEVLALCFTSDGGTMIALCDGAVVSFRAPEF